ncbi:hypothetical protein NPIL_253961, partial [Nephila pilipes]
FLLFYLRRKLPVRFARTLWDKIWLEKVPPTLFQIPHLVRERARAPLRWRAREQEAGGGKAQCREPRRETASPQSLRPTAMKDSVPSIVDQKGDTKVLPDDEDPWALGPTDLSEQGPRWAGEYL